MNLRIQKLLISRLVNGELGAVLLGIHCAGNVNEYSLNNIIVAILGGEDDCVRLILGAVVRSILCGCQLSSRTLTVLSINTDYIVIISEVQSLLYILVSLGILNNVGDAVAVNICSDCGCILGSRLDFDVIRVNFLSLFVSPVKCDEGLTLNLLGSRSRLNLNFLLTVSGVYIEVQVVGVILGAGRDCAGYIAVYAGIGLSSLAAQVDSADCNVLGAVVLVVQTFNLDILDGLPVGYGLAGNDLNAVLVVNEDYAVISKTNLCGGLAIINRGGILRGVIVVAADVVLGNRIQRVLTVLLGVSKELMLLLRATMAII